MSNPLARYFRQPAIYIKLPSGGKFYPDGAISIPPTNELPVYPMTAIDEITYRTPDALFNGSAITEVIKSCIPAISDPWAIPVVDLDAILIGIRIASYGHTMDIETTCPHCAHDNEYELDLRVVLDSMRTPSFDDPIRVGELEIYCRPLSYRDLNNNNRQQFEDQRVIQAIPDSTLPDNEKLERLQAALKSLTELTVTAVAHSIAAIKTADTLVVEREFIEEYVRKADRGVYQRIKDRIVELREETEPKPLTIKCQNPDCAEVYETPFTLDVSNFFG